MNPVEYEALMEFFARLLEEFTVVSDFLNITVFLCGLAIGVLIFFLVDVFYTWVDFKRDKKEHEKKENKIEKSE